MGDAGVAWPRKTREVVNAVMDSTRWNGFEFRDGDIVIATWSKSGTTWMQQIVAQLVFQGDATVFGQALSPWIDFQLTPEAGEQAKAQTHRRFMKTHLPIDALVFSERAKYIYIARDARDVAWSFHHHLSSFTPAARDRFAEIGARVGSPPPPPVPKDARAFYHAWLAAEAASPSGFFRNVQGWWNARGLPNVLLVHYNTLKSDLAGEMRRIASFLDIAIDEERFGAMRANCSLDHMKDVAARAPLLDYVFEGGGRTFINKGTNGRWRDVLTAEEIAKADAAAAELLDPDCARWLRTGEMAGA